MEGWGYLHRSAIKLIDSETIHSNSRFVVPPVVMVKMRRYLLTLLTASYAIAYQSDKNSRFHGEGVSEDVVTAVIDGTTVTWLYKDSNVSTNTAVIPTAVATASSSASTSALATGFGGRTQAYETGIDHVGNVGI